jgi:hypothetical protein
LYDDVKIISRMHVSWDGNHVVRCWVVDRPPVFWRLDGKLIVIGPERNIQYVSRMGIWRTANMYKARSNVNNKDLARSDVVRNMDLKDRRIIAANTRTS